MDEMLLPQDLPDRTPPDDFPWSGQPAAVSGAMPKLLLRRTGDGRYTARISPEERMARWRYCEDLAHQFAAAAQASKEGKRAHLSQAAILEQYLARLIEKRWASSKESHWIMQRAAQLLGWGTPAPK